MTGENHVSYNKGLKRYIMGNYGFINEKGEPQPYHQTKLWDSVRQSSQLTIFEAPEPWGPWSVFHQNDNWGMRRLQSKLPDQMDERRWENHVDGVFRLRRGL